MTEQRRLPKSRMARMSKLGRLAGGIVTGVVGEGVRQLSQGQRPRMSELVLTPQNFQKISDRLAEMRGAAMKLGQLLSMESGEFIPAELNQILARLREKAYYMPLGQVNEVLIQAWGAGWQEQFSRFSFTPLASASIGQVHEARLKDGTHLAIKIQYPGIRQSIDSDVDNVAMLLKLVKLLPREIDFDPLLAEAKQQLHQEADYIAEADHLRSFSGFLAGDTRFEVPQVIDNLSTSEVLTMSFLEGNPIEELAMAGAEVRNPVASRLLELSMRELFDWGLVQTDPNFANFRFNADSGRIQLFDFGATRGFTRERTQAFRSLIAAAVKGEQAEILTKAQQVGYLQAGDPEVYRMGVVALVSNACEPIKHSGEYDFAQSDLAARMATTTVNLRVEEKFGRLPPPDVLFLHRKIAGLYLLMNRLRAKIPVSQIVGPFLEPDLQVS